MTCDLCDGTLRDGVAKVTMFGYELDVCKSCLATAEYHVLEICDKCKSSRWVSCDWRMSGIAHFVTTCQSCGR